MKPVSKIYKSVLDHCLTNPNINGKVAGRDSAALACSSVQITFEGYNGGNQAQLFFRVDFHYYSASKKPDDDYSVLLMVDVSTSPDTYHIIKETSI
jgi:hypothetical protein